MPSPSFFRPMKCVRTAEQQHQTQPSLPRITISLISIAALQQHIFEIILVMEKNCSDLQEIKGDYQSVLDILKGLGCEQGKMREQERAMYKIDAQIQEYEKLRDNLNQEIINIQRIIEEPTLSIGTALLQKDLERYQAIARQGQGHDLEAELAQYAPQAALH